MSSTPGPWDNIPKLDHDDKTWTYVIIAGDDDTRIAEVILPDDSTLIAAAPEMLAELEDVRVAIQCQCNEAYTRRGGHEPNAFCYLIPDIDAVIAKARGES
jgi:hypothetical protein